MTDPSASVGVLAAMAAGMISFLSPCVLPLVPGYLSAVSCHVLVDHLVGLSSQIGKRPVRRR